MLTLASYLADNARPVYEGIAARVERVLGEPAVLLGLGWEERLRWLDEGRVDLAFLCGFPYTQRHDGPGRTVEPLCAAVMAAPRYLGRPIYFTDVIVRRPSPFRSFGELRGASYAYNDPGSHSGYNMPRDHLLALGETGGYFGRVVASGSHQRSIQMVADGVVDASGVDSTVLELELALRPELAERLRVVEAIGPQPIPPVVVARHVPEDLKARLRQVFLGMHEDPEGRRVLARGLTARFVSVSDEAYDPIRAMLRRAEAAGFLTLR